MTKLILVTGATGYIASRLIPRLLNSGYRVRALARNPLHLQTRSWFNKVDIIQADVTSPASLKHAFDGVHTAYYLIHNMSKGHGYTSLEPSAARNFAHAAEQTNLKHIIYLGGLADPEQHIAPHMRSRIETGVILRQRKVPVTEFRAGVIAGSGSISFEMIRFMTELFPIIPAPLWMKNKSQPIAIQNVIDYLFAALTNKNGQGYIFEIGGPEITTYKELMLSYAHIRGLNRKMILIPGIPTWFMAFGVGLMTPIPYPIASALIAGLSTDSIVKHPEALKVFPEIKLIDFASATADALTKTHPTHIEHVWDVEKDFGSLPKKHQSAKDSQKTSEAWLTLKHEGCFIIHRELKINSSPEKIFQSIMQFIHSQGWHIEINENNSRVVAYSKNQRFGSQWTEWCLAQNRLAQTIFFSPHGLPGFLYWYLVMPFQKAQLKITG